MADPNQMTVSVDGENFVFDEAASFGALSDEVKKQLAPERVLTEIFVNERAIDLEEEEKLSTTSFKDLGNIAFKSKEVGILLKESLQLAPQIVEAMDAECIDIENFFEAGDFEMANERVAEMSSLVDWLLQLIASLQTYGENSLNSISLSEGNAGQSVERMNSNLLKLHSSLQGQDYDAFRKVLKGDFREEIAVWRELFSAAAKSWTPRSFARES